MSVRHQGSRSALLAAALLVAGLSVSAFASQRQVSTTNAHAPDPLSAPHVLANDDRATQAQALREGRPLDLNLATVDDLRLLPGLGPMLASRIVSHRQRVGRFERIDQLDAVPGIGPKTLRRITPMLTLVAATEGSTPSQGEQPTR